MDNILYKIHDNIRKGARNLSILNGNNGLHLNAMTVIIGNHSNVRDYGIKCLGFDMANPRNINEKFTWMYQSDYIYIVSEIEQKHKDCIECKPHSSIYYAMNMIQKILDDYDKHRKVFHEMNAGNNLFREIDKLVLNGNTSFSYGDILFIPYPERRLSMRSICNLARILTYIANSGIRVCFNTQSDILIRELSNLIMLYKLDPEIFYKEKVLSNYYCTMDFLDPSAISVFEGDGNGNYNRINFNEEGIDFFDNSVDEIFNRSTKLEYYCDCLLEKSK